MALDLIKNADNTPPATLGDAAANAERNVLAETKLKSGFEVASRAGHELNEADRQQRDVLKRVLGVITEVNQKLVTVLNQDSAAVKAAFMTDFKAKEQDSFIDHKRKAGSYRAILASLHAKASTDSGMTANEWIAMSKTYLATIDLTTSAPGYVMANFSNEVVELLKKPYVATEHTALRTAILNKITADKIPVDYVMTTELDGFFWTLKNLSGMLNATNLLSEDAIEGMIGKVLSDGEMDTLFNSGDVEVIKNLESGSVKIQFLDSEHVFYHTKGTDDVPAAVKAILTDATMPRRILFTHYRTDADVLTLFKDMSVGETLTIDRMDVPGSIVIEGLDGDEFNVIINPAGVTKDQFVAAPMQYLDHEFDMPTQVI